MEKESVKMETVEIGCKCKDCKFYSIDRKGKSRCHYLSSEPYYYPVEADDFYSNGEKRK